jgi:hypothetical protein
LASVFIVAGGDDMNLVLKNEEISFWVQLVVDTLAGIDDGELAWGLKYHHPARFHNQVPALMC